MIPKTKERFSAKTDEHAGGKLTEGLAKQEPKGEGRGRGWTSHFKAVKKTNLYPTVQGNFIYLRERERELDQWRQAEGEGEAGVPLSREAQSQEFRIISHKTEKTHRQICSTK